MRNVVRVIVLISVLATGCSGGPERVKPPKINASSAANQSMELYDKNHDGKLSQEELGKCPGVLINIDTYDLNHDKMIDEEEFRSHLADLLKSGTGGTELGCNVSYQGKPLAGATVVFEPEPYLGSDIQTAEGVTSNYGSANLGIPAEKVPAALRSIKLIQYGTFKVRITHPTIKIPAKYNTETTLGYETHPGERSVSFTLK
jgi:hypothetical protein